MLSQSAQWLFQCRVGPARFERRPTIRTHRELTVGRRGESPLVSTYFCGVTTGWRGRTRFGEAPVQTRPISGASAKPVRPGTRPEKKIWLTLTPPYSQTSFKKELALSVGRRRHVCRPPVLIKSINSLVESFPAWSVPSRIPATRFRLSACSFRICSSIVSLATRR